MRPSRWCTLPDVAERTQGLRAALSTPSVYRVAQWALGATRARRVFVAEFLRPTTGLRVLDVGCGPGTLVPSLPRPSAYLGVDLNPAYVAAASARYRAPFHFVTGDAGHLALPDAARFDLVIVAALLHHLDDDAALGLIGTAARHLVPTGRLVALENSFVEGQHRVARRLIEADRGTSVRTPEGYRALLERGFEDVRICVRHDLLRVPYTHAIAECATPRTISG